MSGYPMHDKLIAVKDQSQAIGEFLEWLTTEKSVCLADRTSVGGIGRRVVTWHLKAAFGRTGDEGECPSVEVLSDDPVKLLAEYFEIDLDVLEDEKRAMLAGIRAVQAV